MAVSNTSRVSSSSPAIAALSHRPSPLRPNAPEFVPKCRQSHQQIQSSNQQQQCSKSNDAFALISVPISLADIDESHEQHNGLSYASAVTGNDMSSSSSTMIMNDTNQLMCPYMMVGQCFFGDNCSWLHGEMCDLCNRPVLHPNDQTQRAKHRRVRISCLLTRIFNKHFLLGMRRRTRTSDGGGICRRSISRQTMRHMYGECCR